MFYLKHKGRKIYIDYDNVFTTCPQCGIEHKIDIQEVLSMDCADLCATSVYCEKCSRRRVRSV